MEETGVLELRQRIGISGTLHLMREAGSRPVCGTGMARWTGTPAAWLPGSLCERCRGWARRVERRGDVRLIVPSGWLEQDGS